MMIYMPGRRTRKRRWESGASANPTRRFGRSRRFRQFFLAGFLATVSLSHATSIVILRSPHGTKIVVASDSQFSIDSASPVSGCKIVQIEKTFWTAISGLASEPGTSFNAYQIVLNASSHGLDLDDIVSEAQARTLATLPSALKHRRKAIGEQAFRQQYKEGFDAHEEAFWGLENGTLRLIYVQYLLHRGRFGKLSLSPVVHKCPGDACADPASGLGVFLGHHKIIDKFTAENPDWPKQAAMETQAQRFVQMEIDSEPDCHCSLPVAVLRMDRQGNTNWIGETGRLCRSPN
jgi:hypothetical protein